MFEIIPNWHPFFVHFTIGLLLTSVLLFVASHFVKDAKGHVKDHVVIAGKWMLWVGALFTLATVATGFYAFATVAHDDPSHLAMKDHRLWALGTAGIFVILAGISFLQDRKNKPLAGWFTPALVIGAVLLGVTGYKGGELVYRHGLGVMSLPEAEGEGHTHEEGEGHDEATAEGTAPPADLSNFDTTTPSGTVNAFLAALKTGDGDAAMSFLDPGVLIYESGYVERSAEEYAGHHLPADMKFSAAMSQEMLSQTETVSGDTATVVSESRTFGTFNDKDYNLLGTGTMVLKRHDDGWKIIHIHWSSRDAG